MSLKFCPQCGAKLIDGTRFCSGCGFNIYNFLISRGQAENQIQKDLDNIINTTDMLDEGFNSPSKTYSDSDIPLAVPNEKEKNNAEYQNMSIQAPNYATQNNSQSLLNTPPPGVSLDSPPPSAPPITPYSAENDSTPAQEGRVRQRPSAKPPTKGERPSKRPAKNNSTTRTTAGQATRTRNKPSSNMKTSESTFQERGYEQEDRAQSTDTSALDSFLDDASSDSHDSRSGGRTSRGSRQSSSSAASGRKKKTITQTATDIASKRLISEDTTYKGRRRVYIIDQEQLVDPDDPSYDCYYENVIPIDQAEKDNKKEKQQRQGLSKEAKQTFAIIGILIVVMIVVIIKEFA